MEILVIPVITDDWNDTYNVYFRKTLKETPKKIGSVIVDPWNNENRDNKVHEFILFQFMPEEIEKLTFHFLD